MLQATHPDGKKNKSGQRTIFLPRGHPQVQSAMKMTNQQQQLIGLGFEQIDPPKINQRFDKDEK